MKKTTKPAVTRRGIFALAGASAAAAATPSVAQSFGSGFTHNVASGEPQANSVLLWTRYVADQATILQWQVSEAQDFANVVASGEVEASPASDYCAKATATGLLPDRWYFFRFTAPSGAVSPVGRTRTLPLGPTSKFRMAVFSCANFGFGYFNAYAHAIEENEVDLAVHLGDYIYEYGGDTYPSQDQRHPNRSVAPGGEIVALADYRLRYASYRADPDLQRLHQVLPMIAVWDDHESTNDSWKDGAQNHQPDTEGDWETRKEIAKQVYREWMPVSDKPYAAYDVGDLATLVRLDTRLEGRDEQFSLQAMIAGKETPEAMVEALTAFRKTEYVDPNRQLLGKAQEQWLGQELAKSTARRCSSASCLRLQVSAIVWGTVCLSLHAAGSLQPLGQPKRVCRSIWMLGMAIPQHATACLRPRKRLMRTSSCLLAILITLGRLTSRIMVSPLALSSAPLQ